ncbi:tripartite tricarboxylate transporter substrate binding protein [Hydrogenophaga sp.]|uniref:Bug family tripartite tricarboxylate transporter substrate binding protein n=1 Tax=Hydrogenophaga sp. TaxID=1904254 RepID=UPI0027283997|nr:tripartite tricarboxylate transporter substrate binding protein [Hydrogenophaga sp.]MDO9437898.1 tripartite tricarboxylate transporter substrate binding protein [Hydrogenophaga sp.]
MLKANRRQILLAGAGAAASLASAAAFAQPWKPSKPIKWVIPFVPGGASDFVARAISNDLSTIAGTPVVLENKGGSGGVIAMQDVARAAPDGHTIILGHVGTLAVAPILFPNAGYDVDKDFAPVTLLATLPSVFVVHPDVPARNLEEFVTYLKKNPEALSYASAGNASASHLGMEHFKVTTGTSMLHVPYKGTGAALNDLLAGRTHAFNGGLSSLLSSIKAGKLRVIATGTRERIPSLPDVPTVAERGYPGFESVFWYGVLAPSRTPPDVLEGLRTCLTKALRTPAVAARFASEDATLFGTSPSEFKTFIGQERQLWQRVIKQARIKVD